VATGQSGRIARTPGPWGLTSGPEYIQVAGRRERLDVAAQAQLAIAVNVEGAKDVALEAAVLKLVVGEGVQGLDGPFPLTLKVVDACGNEVVGGR
jgi:hypothetical protein